MKEEFKMERIKSSLRSHMIYVAGFISSLFLFVNIAIASDRIHIGLVSAEPLQLFAWAAKDGGHFMKYDLDVDLPVFFGSRKIAQSLLSGDLKVAMLGGPPLINAYLSGANLSMTAGFVNFASYELIAGREFRKVEDLRGKVVAVSSFGGASDFLTRYVLRQHGLNPDKDLKVIQIEGGPAVRLAAMEKGAVHAALLILPFTNQAKKLGFSSLADLSKTGPSFQQIGLAALRGFAAERRELVLRILRALLEAVSRLKEDENFGVQTLVRNMKMDSTNPEQVRDARDAVRLYVSRVERVPYASEKGLQTIIEVAALTSAKAKSVNPRELIDVSFLSQLEAEGFVRK